MKFDYEAVQRVAAADWLPYIFVALAIVPAAIIVTILPVAWLLGSVGFFFNGLSTSGLQVPLILLWLCGLAVSSMQRDWIAALLILPLLLLIWPPALGGPAATDRLGAALLEPSPPTAFYPDVFDAAHYEARLQRLEQAMTDRGPLILPPKLPPLDTLRTRLEAAKTAVAEYNSAKADTAGTLAELQKRKGDLTNEQQTLATNPLGWCRTSGLIRLNDFASFKQPFCMHMVHQRLAQIAAEMTATDKGISAAGNDPTASNRYGVALSKAATAKATLETYERWIVENASFTRFFPYLALASIAFAVLIWRRGFQSSAMATLALGTVAGSVLAAWPLHREQWLVEAPRILFPIFACLLSAVALRYVYRAYLDNRGILQAFRDEQGANVAKQRAGAEWVHAALWRAFILWIPFAFVIYGFTMVGDRFYTEMTRYIYCQKDFCQNVEYKPVEDSDPDRDTLRDDLHAASQRLFAELEAKALTAANSVENSNAVAEAKNAAMAKIEELIRPNSWDWDASLLPPGCKFLESPKCYLLERKPLQAVARMYSSWRNSLIARTRARLDALAARVESFGDTAAAEFRNGISGESQALALYSTKLIDSAFLYLAALTMIKYALFTMIAVRGFLLIFARTVYRRDPDGKIRQPYLALAHTAPGLDERNGAPTIRITEYSELRVRLKVDESLLMKRRYDPDNSPPSVTLPMWRRWFWHRAANGCLLLNEVKKPDDSGPVELTLSGNAQLIVWTIRKGQRVGFRWRDFVGMSRHAELDRSVSLRLGTLVLGHLMLPFVRCPGDEPVQLILRSAGAPDKTHGTQTSRSPRRLLSWSEETPFQIVASERPISVYFDDCHVEPDKDGWAVLDVGGDMGGGSTIFKEFLRLFRP